MITAEVFQREIGALRDELRAGFGEMRKEIVEVRKEMQVGFANVRILYHGGGPWRSYVWAHVG